ncbi:MAG: glycosyltransferase [Gammaproteobacteria bacterium]
MRLLFIGESWLGSCARSLKEALARNGSLLLEEVNEDLCIPRPRARWLRAIARLLATAYRQELYSQVLSRVEAFRPDVVVVYKGTPIEAAFVRRLQALGCKVANIYPDYSPHTHGSLHRKAVGAYDVVITTKLFHPALWRSVYGYENRCVFVPQGYDPLVHLIQVPQPDAAYDVVLVATWRLEYGELMKRLGEHLPHGVSVAIGGHGWHAHRAELRSNWTLLGGVQGRGYLELLRQGRVCIAPVTREVVVDGVRQPGDQDSTRTYELAAAHCFFIHRRTEFVQSLYDEHTEVPMYDTPEELAEKILHFLPLAPERALMAAAAHRRAVPAYGLDSRAVEVADALAGCLKESSGSPHGATAKAAAIPTR